MTNEEDCKTVGYAWEIVMIYHEPDKYGPGMWARLADSETWVHWDGVSDFYLARHSDGTTEPVPMEGRHKRGLEFGAVESLKLDYWKKANPQHTQHP